jgi:hypothetical protein
MSVQEDNGQDGTDAPDGVVMINDGAFYPSRSGFKTTNTKAQIQNILSTQGISDNISTDVNNLSADYMGSCVGLEHDQRILWALPYSSTANNQIWVLDLRQRGAWVRPWNIAAKWLWKYADNTDGKTKLLALVNNKFMEIDPNTFTNDNGVGFDTNISSGDIRFGKNNESASILDVTFYFLRPQGSINLAVNAYTEDGLIPFAQTMPNTANQTISAHGRFGWGGSGFGQVMSSLIGISAAEPQRKWTIEVEEECDHISWAINTQGAGVYYQLSKVIIRYVPIGFKEVDNA